VQTGRIPACEVTGPFQGQEQECRFVDVNLVARQTRDIVPQPVGCGWPVGDLMPFGQGANGRCDGIRTVIRHGHGVTEIETKEKQSEGVWLTAYGIREGLQTGL